MTNSEPSNILIRIYIQNVVTIKNLVDVSGLDVSGPKFIGESVSCLNVERCRK